MSQWGQPLLSNTLAKLTSSPQAVECLGPAHSSVCFIYGQNKSNTSEKVWRSGKGVGKVSSQCDGGGAWPLRGAGCRHRSSVLPGELCTPRLSPPPVPQSGHSRRGFFQLVPLVAVQVQQLQQIAGFPGIGVCAGTVRRAGLCGCRSRHHRIGGAAVEPSARAFFTCRQPASQMSQAGASELLGQGKLAVEGPWTPSLGGWKGI